MDLSLRGLSTVQLKQLQELEVERIQGEIDNITAIMEEEITQEAPVTGEMIALLVVLSIFTVVGSVGNGLVLFVFSRVRDKTTAQLFILALAAIDLFTCMIIIPLTMFVEYTRYDIQLDWLCKLYQFLITSKVPLSAFIMVAIAFDRYFCICHPLRKIITTRRTKITIVSLTLFAAMLGVMTSLAYGVNQAFYPYDPAIYASIRNSTFPPVPAETIKPWAKLGEDPSIKNDVTMRVELRLKDWALRQNFITSPSRKGVQETVYIGICAPNEILLSWDFVSVYQKCYTALFLICLVMVGILYGMIYHFIGKRRNKKLQQRLVLCAYVNSAHGCREIGTRTTMVQSNLHDNHNDDDRSACSTQGLGPGGIYIGGCTTTDPPLTSSLSSSCRAASTERVTFVDVEPQQEKLPAEDRALSPAPSLAELKTGHSPSQPGDTKAEEGTGEVAAVPRDEHSSGSTHATPPTGPARRTATSSVKGSEEIQPDDSAGQSGSTGSHHKPLFSRSKKRRVWKSSRRPKSFGEDLAPRGDRSITHRFGNRRASSPFRREAAGGAGTGKPAAWVEMRVARVRRDSEPYRGPAFDLPLDWTLEPHEDLLTIGSRSRCLQPCMDFAVEQRCAGQDHAAAARLSGSQQHREPREDLASIPIIKITHNDSPPDPRSCPDTGHSVTAVPNSNDEDGRHCVPSCDRLGERRVVTDAHCSPVVELAADIAVDEQSDGASLTRDLDSQRRRSAGGVLNNQCPGSSAQQPSQLTSYVRNLSPSCSTSSCNLSPRQSYSNVSRRWTMEGHDIGDGNSSLESRTSTMDSTTRRPYITRKKRWQRFRCTNASLRGGKGRHKARGSCRQSASMTSSQLNGRRSVVSYDAERLREETRAANARTALMLFTVTLVFVVAFLPAWLMAHRLVTTQLMVFYLYFTYNVANPFIYAFMNVIFKDHLRKIFRCRVQR